MLPAASEDVLALVEDVLPVASEDDLVPQVKVDFSPAKVSFKSSPLVASLQGWASVLFKRTFRSLRSFAFFIKERSVLSVLFRSFPFFLKERSVLSVLFRSL